MQREYPALGLSLALAWLAAAIGGIGSVSAPVFYLELSRPAWAPPGWVFGPVWSVLYTLMGVAAWLVWRVRAHHAVRGALALYLVQLAVNALWSWIFFAWRAGGWALVEVLLLLVLIVFTLRAFHRVRPLAAALLLPYLCWVGFASWLTWTLWRANPALL